MASPVWQTQASTTNSTAGTSITISKPSGVVEGDLMVASLTLSGNNTISTVPSGWTLIRRANNGTDVTHATYWKVAGASEGTSYQWGWSSSVRNCGSIHRITGHDPTTPIEGSAVPATGSSTTPDPPSYTPGSSQDYLFLATFGQAAKGNSATPPTNYTERSDLSTSGAGPNSAHAASSLATRALTTGSAENPGTFASATNGTWVAQTIAIQPVASQNVTGSAAFAPGLTFAAGTATRHGDLVSDDFDDNDLTTDPNWGSPPAGIVNSSGYVTVTVNATTPAPTLDLSMSSVTELWWYATVHVESQSSSNGNRIQGFGPRDGGEKVAMLGFTNSGGDIVLHLLHNDDAGQTFHEGTTALSTGTDYDVEVYWRRTSGVNTNDGVLRLYLDGATTPEINVTDLDDEGQVADNFRLGNNFREGMTITFRVDNLEVSTVRLSPDLTGGAAFTPALSFPQGTVSEAAAEQNVTGSAAFTPTLSFPQGQIDLTVLGSTFTPTLSFPQGSIDLTVSGATFTPALSFPAGQIDLTVTGTTFTPGLTFPTGGLSQGLANTYYVSSSGSDSEGGTTPATAWQTVAQVNASSFSAGDTILFNRGDVWRETLVPPSSGASGNPITFGAYGSGAKPRITGADVVSSFADAGGNQWTATVTPDPRVVRFVTADEYGREQATSGAVDTDYEWHWAGNTLTVYATSDPSGDIEVAARNNACNPDGVSYLEFDNIQFDTALTYAFQIEGIASNINLTDVDLLRAFIDNFQTGGSATVDDCTLTRVASSYAGASGYTVASNSDNILFDTCTSDHDSYVDGVNFGRSVSTFGGGFKLVSDRTVNDITNCVFDSCTVTHAGYLDDDTTEAASVNKGFGFWIDLVAASVGNENIVRNSEARNCRQAGFFAEKTDWSLWHHNLAVGCGGPGLFVGGRYDPDPPPTDNNKFYNFTLYGCAADTISFDTGNIHVSGGYASTGDQLSDNQFRNILTANSQGAVEGLFENGGENDGTNGSNNTYEYLSFGAESTGFVEFQNGTTYNTYAAWDTAYQASTGVDIDALHYLNADATFVNAPTDLSLATLSPPVDRGVAISGITDGYYGVAPDLGFEESTELPVRGSVFQPTLTFPAGTVSQGTQTLTGALFTPTLTFPQGSVDLTVTGALFAPTLSFPTGTVNQEQFVSGSLFTPTLSFPQGSIDLTIAGALFAPTLSFPQGNLALEQTLVGAAFAPTLTFPQGSVDLTIAGATFAPTLSFPQGQLDLTVVGSLFTPTLSFPAGAVAGGDSLAGATFTPALSFPAGAVVQEQFVSGSLFTPALSFPQGSIDLALGGALFAPALTFPQGNMAQVQTVSGSLFAPTLSFPTGSIDLALAGSLFTPTLTFPQGSLDLTVTGALFALSPTFPSGSLAFTVLGSTFAPTLTFGDGTIVTAPSGTWQESKLTVGIQDGATSTNAQDSALTAGRQE